MKNTMRGAVAALALAVAVLPAQAQDVEFTLINDSTQALHYFFTTPSNDEDWGEDLLGETGTLEAGYQGTVSIGDGSDQCLYDFRFVMESGDELIAAEIDICSLGSYTIED